MSRFALNFSVQSLWIPKGVALSVLVKRFSHDYLVKNARGKRPRSREIGKWFLTFLLNVSSFHLERGQFLLMCAKISLVLSLLARLADLLCPTKTIITLWKKGKSTVFENHRKSLILQLCERSELRLPFEWTKVNEKCQLWWLFENLKACGQKVLQDRSLLIGHKLGKNAKIRDSNETFWVD